MNLQKSEGGQDMDHPENQCCKEKKIAKEKQNLGALRLSKVRQEIRPIRLRLELVDHPRNKEKMDDRIQHVLKTWESCEKKQKMKVGGRQADIWNSWA